MVAVRQQRADSFPTVQRPRVARMLVLEGRAPSALSVQCCRVLTVTRYSKLRNTDQCRTGAPLRPSRLPFLPSPFQSMRMGSDSYANLS